MAHTKWGGAWLVGIGLIAAIAVAQATAALAQQAEAPKRKPGAPPTVINGKLFGQFVRSKAYLKNLSSYVLQYETRYGPCAKPTFEGRARLVPPEKPVRLSKYGTPPQWYEVLKIGGCEKPFERVVFTTIINKKMTYAALLLGESRTDPQLQWDTLQTLIPVAKAASLKHGCAEDAGIRLLWARVDGEAAKNAPWREVWTVADCKGKYDYQVTFTPAKTGGTTFAIRKPGE